MPPDPTPAPTPPATPTPTPTPDLINLTNALLERTQRSLSLLDAETSPKLLDHARFISTTLANIKSSHALLATLNPPAQEPSHDPDAQPQSQPERPLSLVDFLANVPPPASPASAHHPARNPGRHHTPAPNPFPQFCLQLLNALQPERPDEDFDVDTRNLRD